MVRPPSQQFHGPSIIDLLQVDKEGAINIDDAAGFFANVFGGERFVDYVRHPTRLQPSPHPFLPQIGEISIMKDMTSVATTMMSEEEKAEIERQMNGGVETSSSPSINKPSTSPVGGAPAPAPPPHHPNGATATGTPPAPRPTTPSKPTNGPSPTSSPDAPPAPSTLTSLVSHADSANASPSSPTTATAQDKEKEKERQKEAARRRAKLTQEQREKLREQERERKKVMEARVAMLSAKMIERLRPFVEAKHPGEKDDPETMAYEERMKREAEDLKLESFGVEVSFCARPTGVGCADGCFPPFFCSCCTR